MNRKRNLMGALAVMSVMGAGTAFAQQPTLELMHFWTSGGESNAMQVIKDAVQAAGIAWQDAAVAGGAGMNAYQVLQARIAAGNPPAGMQMHSAQIRQFAQEGLLIDLDAVASAQGWDKEGVLDPQLKAYAYTDGHWVGAPFNTHRHNWLWINKALLDKYGGTPPATWEDFFAMADKMKADGVIPIAHGGQAWQELFLWEAVANGVGGPAFHKAAIEELDPEALSGDTMKQVFDTYRKVLSYVDPGYPNRDWNLSIAMVMDGQAAMALAGDWALGEFNVAGKQANVDYVCANGPGTDGQFVWLADYWGFFKGLDEQGVKAQQKLAEITMDPAIQEEFNIRKGSIPARLDVKPDKFGFCGQKGIADRAAAVAAGTMVPSLSQNSAQTTDVRGVFEDAVNEFANTPDMTADEAIAKINQGLAEL
ncbi:MAG TPA: ABC transporter substrate-binding protein [Bauldia sp.]|nr:ABC transporter substrate-binding protein [Bauldia sp.]